MSTGVITFRPEDIDQKPITFTAADIDKGRNAEAVQRFIDQNKSSGAVQFAEQIPVGAAKIAGLPNQLDEKGELKVEQPSAVDMIPGVSVAKMGWDMLKQHADLVSQAADHLKNAYKILTTQTGAPLKDRLENAQAEAQAGLTKGAAAALPIVGPAAVQAGEAIGHGVRTEDWGEVGQGVGQGATLAATSISPKKVSELPPGELPNISPRGALAKQMSEARPGEPYPRGEVAAAADTHGVNLDLAQATDSPTISAVKTGNRLSIGSQAIYSKNAASNLEALGKWAEEEAGKYAESPADRQAVGGALQQAMKKHLDQLKTSATTSFKELDKQIGAAPVDVTNTVEDAAKEIVSQNKAYYEKHPDLTPKHAWSVINDLATRPEATEGLEAGAKAPQNIMSWSELHRLRSDLMDLYRNSPDIVKGQSEAWLQRMVKTLDDSMTSAAGGMSPEQQMAFRSANKTWETIKSTYDNPQSPYYHAVRSATPSQVPGMLSKGSPELAKSVRDTLSSLDDAGTVEGDFQRHFVDTILNGKDGVTLDLQGLDARLKRIPQDHLEAMLGKDGAKQLRLLGNVAKRVTEVPNPSGTAKYGVPAGEVGLTAANPPAGIAQVGLQHVAAKAMNSARLRRFLTEKSK